MNIQGVLVPIVTPFDTNNQVNIRALEELVGLFIDKGVAGIVACGTTGEYYALNENERRQVLECVVKAGQGKLSLIAGINSLSTQGAIERAQQAAELGYEGLMLAVPPYSLPGDAEIVAHFRTVAESTDLPLIMYNFPVRVGVEISIESVAELSKIPNIVGIKESSGNFSRALALLKLNLPDFDVICGSDDQAADFLFWGARSWISGGANVFPGEQVAMLAAGLEGRWDDVKSLMAGMYPIIQAMEAGNYNQKAKLGCLRHGIDAGMVRQPLLPLSQSDAERFSELLNTYRS